MYSMFTQHNQSIKIMNEKLFDIINRYLGDNKIWWFGTRGVDATPLTKLTQLSGVFSLICDIDNSEIPSICLENISKNRVDLDSYDIDDDTSIYKQIYINKIEEKLKGNGYLLCYRPNYTLDSFYYRNKLSMFQFYIPTSLQRSFENKAWIEDLLSSEKIPIIKWTYFGANDVNKIILYFNQYNQIVVRNYFSTGGKGIYIVRSKDELMEKIELKSGMFVSLSPLYTPSYSINISTVGFKNGQVSIHFPSLQIIGNKDYVDGSLQYCGNDYGAFSNVPAQIQDKIIKYSIRVTKKLIQYGYRGTLGIDYVVHNDIVYFAEINPRFQGSSRVGANIEESLELDDMYIAHIASFFNLNYKQDLTKYLDRYFSVNIRHLISHKEKFTIPEKAELFNPFLQQYSYNSIKYSIIEKSKEELEYYCLH